MSKLAIMRKSVSVHSKAKNENRNLLKIYNTSMIHVEHCKAFPVRSGAIFEFTELNKVFRENGSRGFLILTQPIVRIVTLNTYHIKQNS